MPRAGKCLFHERTQTGVANYKLFITYDLFELLDGQGKYRMNPVRLHEDGAKGKGHPQRNQHSLQL